MLEEKFDVLITFDKNLKYQQNFSSFPIVVLVINAEDNSYLTLKNFVMQIKSKLSTAKKGVSIIQVDA